MQPKIRFNKNDELEKQPGFVSGYTYGSSSPIYSLADYIQSIQAKYPQPDPIEEQVNISDYEITGKVDFEIDIREEDFASEGKRFSHERFNDIAARTWRVIKSLSELKGGEYAGDTDRLANFREQANTLNLPMETIWAVYASKHWGALMQYIKDLAENKKRDRLEPIDGRIDDLIVYLMLMKAMIEERK